MYKNLLWSLLLLLSAGLKAQVSMTLQVPPEGIIQKPQLWNFLVVNNEATAVQVKISLTMTDAQNDPILSATSSGVFVNNGATPLLATDLSPIQYEYLSPKVTDLDPNGFLPIGQYQVCYTFYVFGHIGFEETSQECISVYVEPVSPPMLSFPFDGSEEETGTPQFSWLPPAPLNMFNNLTYDFTLVEVSEGQTAAEAVQQNMPVYTVSNHPDIFLNYPASHPQLDTGKLYAWQVFANNNGEYAAQSEVWTFKVATIQSDTPSTKQIQYYMLAESIDDQPICTINENNIYLKFYSWDQARVASFSIKDENDSLLSSISVPIVYGDNFLKLSIPFTPVEEKLYSISVSDLDDRIYGLKFMVVQE